MIFLDFTVKGFPYLVEWNDLTVFSENGNAIDEAFGGRWFLTDSDLQTLANDLGIVIGNEATARGQGDQMLADLLTYLSSRIDNILTDPLDDTSSLDGKRYRLSQFAEVFSADQVDGLNQKFALFTNLVTQKISGISANSGTGIGISNANPQFPLIVYNRPDWSEVQNKPGQYPPTSHSNHNISDVTNLETTLAGKENKSSKGVADGYASLDPSGKVPASQIPIFQPVLQIVATITERDNLTPTGNLPVYVKDATLDLTVITGGAFYLYEFATSTWIKLSEMESMDVIQSWANITLKPTEFPPEAHSHTISDITNLQTDLNAKRNLIDNIPASEITESLSQNFVSDTEKTLWNNTALIGAVSGSTTVDLAGNRTARFILTGNIDITAINNAVQDNVYVFYFKQDATGNRTITLPATVLLPSGETPDLTVNKVSLLTMYYDGTNFLGSWKKGW